VTAELFFVVAADAAAGRDAVWPAIADRLHAIGRSFEFEIAPARFCASSFTRQALRAGAQRVVAVGNDRTVHEVVNGLFLEDSVLRPEATVGIIPVGFPTDVAAGLGLAHGLAALEVVLREDATAIDLARAAFLDEAGQAVVRYFVNMAEIGNGMRLALGTLRRGALGAHLGRLLTSMTPGPQTWAGQLSLNGGEPQEIEPMSVIVASGPRGQGGVEVVPGAKMDDGQLAVLLVEPMSTGELMALMPRVLAGTHLEHPKLQLRQAKQVTITTSGWPFIELDNDREGAGGIELGILPGALRMLLPRP